MSNQIYKIKMGGMDIEKKYLNMSGSGDIQIIPGARGADFLFDFVGDVFDTAFDFVGDVFNFVVDNALNIGLTLISGGTLSTVALNALWPTATFLVDACIPSPAIEPISTLDVPVVTAIPAW